jgi:hypothetical protein
VSIPRTGLTAGGAIGCLIVLLLIGIVIGAGALALIAG